MKANSFKQHIPSFCDGFEPETFEFDTVDELLSHPVIKRFSEPFKPQKLYTLTIATMETTESETKSNGKFYRYSLSDNALMAESDGGKYWWVIGFIKHPEKVNLPKWEPVYDKPTIQ